MIKPLKITYAAAHNNPVIIKNNELIQLPADKMPIGKGEKLDKFSLHTIEASNNDMIYFFTDGYVDQFGGEHGKKFKYKQLQELLISINSQPLDNQKQTLYSSFVQWQGNLEQIDDVCIIGIRL
ncbi:MAG: SpoIIE family protein phosphatase [Bacteroidetes bacterium]|nr:SpoIIE family protein phosphatase [Bacteroidota bacterium]